MFPHRECRSFRACPFRAARAGEQCGVHEAVTQSTRLSWSRRALTPSAFHTPRTWLVPGSRCLKSYARASACFRLAVHSPGVRGSSPLRASPPFPPTHGYASDEWSCPGCARWQSRTRRCVRFGDALAWVEARSEAASARRSLGLHRLGDWSDRCSAPSGCVPRECQASRRHPGHPEGRTSSNSSMTARTGLRFPRPGASTPTRRRSSRFGRVAASGWCSLFYSPLPTRSASVYDDSASMRLTNITRSVRSGEWRLSLSIKPDRFYLSPLSVTRWSESLLGETSLA